MAIARAIANDPPLILADEPTGNLDAKTGQMIYELLKDIARERTVIVVTHAEVLAQMADRIVHMSDGKLVAAEHPAEPSRNTAEQTRRTDYA